MRRSISTAVIVVLAGGLASLVACVDVVHEDQVQALGGEQPGVPPGPLHRPGQPCLVCHGGSGPASSQFSIGGTVTRTQGQPDPAPGVQVILEDISGAVVTLTTNPAGNFYVPLQDWTPQYPLQVNGVLLGSNQAPPMSTHISREGSCCGCHQPTGGPTSPGPIYLNTVSSP
ncbi:MAG TPA: carboxypeptidase-like regulatory domain-containing protein [Polyangiaceae bacterium]|nr:carboxypeptidase-like regulatory domain-containing protein [Polyangiaceae bacterium]